MKKQQNFYWYRYYYSGWFKERGSFLNRLKNRIVEEAERVVIDKAADKAQEDGQAMDKVLSRYQYWFPLVGWAVRWT